MRRPGGGLGELVRPARLPVAALAVAVAALSAAVAALAVPVAALAVPVAALAVPVAALAVPAAGLPSDAFGALLERVVEPTEDQGTPSSCHLAMAPHTVGTVFGSG
jgi:hypothetical protein